MLVGWNSSICNAGHHRMLFRLRFPKKMKSATDFKRQRSTCVCSAKPHERPHHHALVHSQPANQDDQPAGHHHTRIIAVRHANDGLIGECALFLHAPVLRQHTSCSSNVHAPAGQCFASPQDQPGTSSEPSDPETEKEFSDFGFVLVSLCARCCCLHRCKSLEKIWEDFSHLNSNCFFFFFSRRGWPIEC